MNRRFARLLVRLHDRSWQVRYGDEFETLLTQMYPSFVIVLDSVGSAARTRVRSLLPLCAALLCAVCLWQWVKAHDNGPLGGVVLSRATSAPGPLIPIEDLKRYPLPCVPMKLPPPRGRCA